MTENELQALLVLQHIPNIGDGSIKKLIRIFGSAEEVLKQDKKALLAIDGIGKNKVASFWDDAHYAFAKTELAYMAARDIKVASYNCQSYPKRLKHCIDGPILLFSRGRIDWENKHIISIVGTRKITSYGSGFIKEFIEELKPLNPLIVSGFAYGVDITAHRESIKQGLQNVGVLAHGLNTLYPKAHSKYVVAMEENGGFVTDFSSAAPFIHKNFLQRNRIIAGLSEATVVIESARKGGSLVTADFANGYHRDVLAVPGRTDDAMSIGCNNLIKSQQAHLLTSAADLKYILNWQEDIKRPRLIQKQLFIELTSEEKVVHNFLRSHGKEQLDLIALHCKLPTYKIASLLLQMEMKGVIKALPGKLFESI